MFLTNSASINNLIATGSFTGSFIGNGSGLTGIVASATPGGPNQSVQFNDGGVVSGSSNFLFNKNENYAIISGALSIGGGNTYILSPGGGFTNSGSLIVGLGNFVSSPYSLVAGLNCSSSRGGSTTPGHAIGWEATATGAGSVALNRTTATGTNQTTVGQHNISGSTVSSAFFIIGDGISSSNRRNLLVARTGSIEISGSLTVTQGGITGSLLGTASFALTASYVTSTAGVGTTPTATQTDTVNHGLGRIPAKIRIYGMAQFTSNAAATPVPFSIGIWTQANGNLCIYQPYNTAAITTTQAAATSTAFAVRSDTGANSFVQGVIQNVGNTSFQIAWTETGTAAAKVYMWEAE